METRTLFGVARHRFIALVSGLALLLASTTASAQETRDSAATDANKRLRIGLGPEVIVPSDSGPLGGGVVLDGRYGFKAGPTVLAPGGRLDGYILSNRLIGIAMPTFRLTLPIGPLAPYAVGGIGGGWLSNRSESGLALLGGGGLMVHFGRIIAIGVELTYQRITGTEFEGVAIGPSIQFGG